MKCWIARAASGAEAALIPMSLLALGAGLAFGGGEVALKFSGHHHCRTCAYIDREKTESQASVVSPALDRVSDPGTDEPTRSTDLAKAQSSD
jgi:hypothetical protein